LLLTESKDGTPSAIGGFLSTSNHLKEEEVHVTTENEIIWTVEIQAD
jgi:thiamine pyrophosphokinase